MRYRHRFKFLSFPYYHVEHMLILLIDDNEKLCGLYQQILAKGGHDARIETDPTKALDAIRAVKPDLLLLDLMMEPISGWDVLEQIRSSPELAELPVIILTGKVLTAPEALKYGMIIEGFIMKPLERNMLLAAIDEVKNVLDESEERYLRALSSGMSPDKALSCKTAIKKMKMLLFLRETLSKQERLMSQGIDEGSDLMNNLSALREMIAREFSRIHQETENCP
ncbi:hypothetical protein DLD82_04655 [Methanospirillum stamsii]|uniref:Response regulatory domain-containing protein n=2 Tax=Methanospirillum stamsii TaxID=1277351 RepID=A0A2V2NIK0_9EURY|nr:hypothetical protein DLD82_04655 [Methanospirillum stamsii]